MRFPSKWMVRSALFLFLAQGTLSCGNVNSGVEGLKITISPSTSFIFTDVNAKANSCVDYNSITSKSVVSPRIRFNELKIEWTGEGTVELITLKIIMNGTNVSGNFSLSADPEELACLFIQGVTASATKAASFTLTTGQSISNLNSTWGTLVGFNIGGIALSDRDAPTFISGTIKLVAIYTAPGKDPVQILSTGEFSAEGNNF